MQIYTVHIIAYTSNALGKPN